MMLSLSSLLWLLLLALLIQTSSASLTLLHTIHPGCDRSQPVMVHYSISGGTDPYRVVGDCVAVAEAVGVGGHQSAARCPWTGRLVIMDMKGEKAIVEVAQSLENYAFLNVVVDYVQEGEILLYTARISGGTPPYATKWSSGSINTTTSIGLPLQEMEFEVRDSQSCGIAYSPYLGSRDVWCPSIHDCSHLPLPFSVTCYKKLCWDALTEQATWHHCSARAAVRMITAIRKKLLGVVDHGAAFFALRLLKGARLDPRLIRQFLEYDADLLLLFDSYTRGHLQYKELLVKSLAYMIGLKAKRLPMIDTLVVSPAGFYNEPIFAPQLAHGQRRVAILVTKEGVFPSSLVRNLVSPITLEIDIDLAAHFLKSVLALLKPRWVFPGDSPGILTIAKATGAPYPPPLLGKLPKGHEIFSPQEHVISENDGFRTIAVDLELANAALESLGGAAYLKREYSDAARGVMAVTSANLAAAIESVMPRGIGVDQMDLSLPVRLFLQRRVTLGDIPRIYGFRFYARNGTVVAAHTSQVVSHVSDHALEYVTVRDEMVEKSSLAYIASHSFDGFGSAWWFFDVSHGPFLLDFNARLERHACIAAILQGPEKLLCPCVYFALELSTPFTPVPAGRKYTDPIRMARSHKHYTSALWNVRREDLDLMEWIRVKHKREAPAEEDEEMFVFN